MDHKLIKLAYRLSLVLVMLAAMASTVTAAPEVSTISYSGDTVTVFPNPERGWHKRCDVDGRIDGSNGRDGGDDQQPEAQMGGHLHTAANTHMPSAVVAVQMRVDPFSAVSLAIPNRFRGRELAFFTATGVVVNQGDVAESFGHEANFHSIIRGIGQIVEIGDTPGTHLCQRDGNPRRPWR